LCYIHENKNNNNNNNNNRIVGEDMKQLKTSVFEETHRAYINKSIEKINFNLDVLSKQITLMGLDSSDTTTIRLGLLKLSYIRNLDKREAALVSFLKGLSKLFNAQNKRKPANEFFYSCGVELCGYISEHP
jgi:hypothetical protein